MTHTWNKKINKTPLIKRNNCKNNFLPLKKKKKLLEKKHFEEIKKKKRLHIEFQYSIFHFMQILTPCDSSTYTCKHFQA